MSFPHDVPGRDTSRLAVELDVNLMGLPLADASMTEKVFVEQVKNLDRFELELRCRYQDMDGNVREKMLAASSSYDGFKESVVKNPKESRAPRFGLSAEGHPVGYGQATVSRAAAEAHSLAAFVAIDLRSGLLRPYATDFPPSAEIEEVVNAHG